MPPGLPELETSLAKLLRRAYGIQTGLAVENLARVLSRRQRQRESVAREVAANLVADAERVNQRVLRFQLQGLLENLSELGVVQVSDELRAQFGPRGSNLSRLDPRYLNLQNAALFEAAASEILHDHLKATSGLVTETLLTGLSQAKTEAEIGRDIYGLGTARLRSWADTWAITETTRYYNFGRLAAGDEAAEYLWGWRYVVILDDRTTDICRGYVGKVVESAKLVDVPPFHWRCRTTLQAILRGEYSGEPDPDPARLLDLARVKQRPDPGFGGDPRRALRPA